MEYDINFIMVNGNSDKIRGSISNIEKTKNGNFVTVGKFDGVYCVGYAPQLDLENLPEGAGIVEVEL